MENTKIEYVPHMRFPEFIKTNSWKKFALKDITPCIFDGTHQTPNYVDTGIPFFSVENIISHVKNKYISEDDHFSNTIKNKPEKYDIILTRIGNIGFSQVVTWDYEFSIYVTLAIIKKSNLFDSFFLHYFIQSQACQNEIMRNSLLDAVPCKINLNDLKSIPILLPSTQEQQKIADCLSSLDELIRAHEQKRDALVEHKKGLIQRLFPAEGETTPRWRFPEFRKDREWKKCCIKDVGSVLSGYGFPDKYQGKNNGEFPFYKVSDISLAQKNGICISQAANYIDKDVLKILKVKPIPPYTIIFARIGEAIRLNRRSITTIAAIIDNNVAGIKADEKTILYPFLYYILSNINLAEYSSGVVPAINKSTIEAIQIIIPSIPEQQKIADCLSSLDARIEAEEAKIASLREHKQGLMQRLFPQSL